MLPQITAFFVKLREGNILVIKKTPFRAITNKRNQNYDASGHIYVNTACIIVKIRNLQMKGYGKWAVFM